MTSIDVTITPIGRYKDKSSVFHISRRGLEPDHAIYAIPPLDLHIS